MRVCAYMSASVAAVVAAAAPAGCSAVEPEARAALDSAFARIAAAETVSFTVSEVGEAPPATSPATATWCWAATPGHAPGR
jgi:hypothetical protein